MDRLDQRACLSRDAHGVAHGNPAVAAHPLHLRQHAPMTREGPAKAIAVGPLQQLADVGAGLAVPSNAQGRLAYLEECP